MYILRLFHRDRPFEQIDSRILAEAPITFGRDPSADWVCDLDPTLSRLHCTLSLADDGVTVHDSSTNGVFLDTGARAPRDQPTELRPRQSIRLGSMVMLVDAGPDEAAAESLTSRLPLSATRRLTAACETNAFAAC